jgi:hypothetical protein
MSERIDYLGHQWILLLATRSKPLHEILGLGRRIDSLHRRYNL